MSVLVQEISHKGEKYSPGPLQRNRFYKGSQPGNWESGVTLLEKGKELLKDRTGHLSAQVTVMRSSQSEAG